MGVPAMFRWLSQKYPKIVSGVIEELPQEVDGVKIPVDRSKPNPNGECDNLYLDMNGIVHPCSHPEDKPAPETEADMMRAIFEYTDRVVGMARPRKLLYLAVDGVAPRAKMNQQRSRRFRAAREAKEKDEERAEFQKLLKQQAMAKGEDINTIEEVIKKTWDSNAITPGTPFMFLLAESLQYWCAYKFTTDPSWNDMKVIISDASVPGEGEHKIMNFIRSQRAMPSHLPNTRHVIYGLDADLIMLGLATHEPHFRVLREDVFADSHKDKQCNRCGRKGHGAVACRGEPPLTEEEKALEALKKPSSLKPFIWLHVNVLREYLAVEMDHPGRQFKYDLERALDDWVFMCFFVGNDFLPHLPSLEIRDQGIELLVSIWRELVPRMDDYVTKDGYPNMKRVQQVLQQLGKREATIFRKRKEAEDRKKQRDQEREAQRAARGQHGNNQAPPFKRQKEDTSTYMNAGVVFFAPGDAQSNAVRDATKPFQQRQEGANAHQRVNIIVGADIASNKSAAAALKQKMKVDAAEAKAQAAAEEAKAQIATEQAKAEAAVAEAKARDASSSSTTVEPQPTSQSAMTSQTRKRKSSIIEESDVSVPEIENKTDVVELENGTPGRSTPVVHEPTTAKDVNTAEDTVRLFEPGYEDRYYEQKFNCTTPEQILATKKSVCEQYAYGLCWVLAYYMQGCPSWTWYYPYHYAPFANDFVAASVANINPAKIFRGKEGKAFRPYEQLMAVLPVASNHAIPEPFHVLMTDPQYGITHYYPEDFVIDLNGKKFAWQGIALLPFIDETKLLDAMGMKYPELSDEEHRRNSIGKEIVMFSQEHPFPVKALKSFHGTNPARQMQLEPAQTQGLHGVVLPHDTHVVDSMLVPPFDQDDDEMSIDLQDRSMRMYYNMPEVQSKLAHKSALMPGVTLPAPALNEEDKRIVRNRSKARGFNNGPAPPSRGGYGDRAGGGYNGGGYNGGGYNGGGHNDFSRGHHSGGHNGGGHNDYSRGHHSGGHNGGGGGPGGYPFPIYNGHNDNRYPPRDGYPRDGRSTMPVPHGFVTDPNRPGALTYQPSQPPEEPPLPPFDGVNPAPNKRPAEMEYGAMPYIAPPQGARDHNSPVGFNHGGPQDPRSQYNGRPQDPRAQYQGSSNYGQGDYNSNRDSYRNRDHRGVGRGRGYYDQDGKAPKYDNYDRARDGRRY